MEILGSLQFKPEVRRCGLSRGGRAGSADNVPLVPFSVGEKIKACTSARQRKSTVSVARAAKNTASCFLSQTLGVIPEALGARVLDYCEENAGATQAVRAAD